MTTTTGLENAYTPPASDDAARESILTDLDTNMLVEAGAGSGKTTSLVGRMYALVARGEPVERIAAVTFTRKAANELRERFQLRLEQAIRESEPGSEARVRADRALRDLDRAFLGTIHSFCGRLLREHPLEVGLDPGFEEIAEEAWDQLVRGFWNRWLERAKLTNDAALVELRALHVDPRTLFAGFKCVLDYRDVEFALAEVPAPDITACRAKLEALLVRAQALIPKEEPAGGWDALMGLVRRLQYLRRVANWGKTAHFCDALAEFSKSRCEIKQYKWSDNKEGKARAKDLSADFTALFDADVTTVLTRWREHRYPAVMRYLQRAAAEFARERHATGQLGFEDLLMLCATLLRENAAVRDALGARYRRLLVDEFQDTDPIQAEVCFLLASEASHGADWRAVTPRPGALFFVGDPKQSIYRFRRADIQVFEQVRAKIAECGAVLALTRNFRSVAPIGDLVNRYFGEGVFPAGATDVQAPFSPMQTVQELQPGDGIYHYAVKPDGRSKDAIVEPDAAQVATWIASRIERGERKAGDFLILTENTKTLAAYARALGERNVPVSTTGAKLPQEHELNELLVVLRAIADPENPVAIAAALEGLFFGCSPADLYDARVAGIHFSITHRPASEELIAARGMAQLHAWWIVSQRHAADVLLERILDDTGLLYYATGLPLGDARAGALLHLIEGLRSASTTGANGITDAMSWIEVLLEKDAGDAPLRPGRADAVRVMNLHKAKGLEAPVVILAAPTNVTQHPPKLHVSRGDAGQATGGMLILDEKDVIAQPAGWDAMADTEARFAAAEKQRLLYVAATRAKRELVIARCEREKTPDTSFWSPLVPLATELGTRLTLEAGAAPGRRAVEREATSMVDAGGAARAATEAATRESIAISTVTESAKQESETARAYDLPRAPGRGAAWGRAVHRAIEAMGNGRGGASLDAFVAAVCADEGLGDDACEQLRELLADVRASDLWQQFVGGGDTRFELPIMQCASGDDRELVTEGVIDAAVRDSDGWWLVDWKTDDVDGSGWERRRAAYERQIGAYERMVASLTGEPVAAALLQRLRVAGENG